MKMIPGFQIEGERKKIIISQHLFLLKTLFWHLFSLIVKYLNSLKLPKQAFPLFLRGVDKHLWFVFTVLSFLTALHSLHRPTGVCLILLLGTFSSLRWKLKTWYFWSSKKELISFLTQYSIPYWLYIQEKKKKEKSVTHYSLVHSKANTCKAITHFLLPCLAYVSCWLSKNFRPVPWAGHHWQLLAPRPQNQIALNHVELWC